MAWPRFRLFNALRSVRTSGHGVWTKLNDVLLALACVGLVWFAFTWNLNRTERSFR